MDGLLHQRDRGCGFLQLQVGRTGDVDQCAMRTLDAFLQQRRADGDFRGLRGAVLSPSGTDAEQRGAGTTQNRVDIVEINVDVRIRGNQVGDALHAGQQCGVGGLERVDDANGAVGQFQQSVVRNDDQRVDFLAQVLDAERGGSGTLRTFEAERTGHHGDGQRALLVGRTCHDRAGTGSGATALTAGDEHHVGALKRLFDVGLVILRRLGTLFRVGASAQTTAGGIVQRDLDIGVGSQQILCISVDRNKFDALKTLRNHAIDSVASGSTDTDDLDVGLVVEIVSLGNLAHHCLLFTHVYEQLYRNRADDTRTFPGVYHRFFTFLLSACSFCLR